MMTTHLLPEPEPQSATATTVAEAKSAPPADGGPAEMSRWLWFALPFADLGISAVWGGVIQVLLGTQVATLVGPHQAPAALGLVSGVAAVSAVLAQPLVGLVADRTRPRLGRRNAWILGGSIVSVLALLATALSPSLPVLIGIWALAMWPLNAVQGSIYAVLPERVPVRSRGAMSGILGAVSKVGSFVGVAIAGLTGNVLIGYSGIAVVVLVAGLLFALTTKDYVPPVAPERSKAERREARRLPSFRTSRDYWWAFAGRFMIVFGYFTVAAFQLYILQNYIKVGDGSIRAAQTALVGLSAASSLAILVCAPLGGWLSDRIQRLRIFVAGATLLLVPAGLIYWLVPTYAGALIANILLGVGFGTYLAVDQALISRVLPNLENAARDMGLMGVANSTPQIIAPVVGGVLVTLLGGYQVLFAVMIVFVIVSAVFVKFIRTVR